MVKRTLFKVLGVLTNIHCIITTTIKTQNIFILLQNPLTTICNQSPPPSLSLCNFDTFFKKVKKKTIVSGNIPYFAICA